MEKLILKYLFILGTLTLAACSPGEVADVSGLDSYSIVSGSFSQADSTALHGTGTVRFSTSLPGVASSRSLTLKASLNDTISASTVTAVLYASDLNIAGSSGVAVKFIRQGASVAAQIAVNGNSGNVSTDSLSFYFPTALDVIIDVHNVGTKSRIYIWRRDNVVYAPTSADIDSEADLSPSLPANQKGAGLFAGLILQNATVTAAQISTSKVLD